MNARRWVLLGVLIALGVVYVACFTEWLRPAPIEIASQVRFAIQPPRFGRPPRPSATGGRLLQRPLKGDTVQVFGPNTSPRIVSRDDHFQFVPQGLAPGVDSSNQSVVLYSPRGSSNVLSPAESKLFTRPAPPANAAQKKVQDLRERIGEPDKGTIDPSPGGAANVTFSFDDWYQLTRLRVEDVPADGTAPKIMWQLQGKSAPINSLLYGRAPTGMKPVPLDAMAESLEPGAPYRLVVEAGRRRGTNNFTTVALAPSQ